MIPAVGGTVFSGKCDDESKVVQHTVRRGILDIFLSMPLDVIFEIFGFLHPRDLIALTHTNKMFRRTVYSRGSVWRRSRLVHHIPDCYPGISEARWAFILFGGNHCHRCGTGNVHKVDFGLCRRVCAECNRKNVIDASEFEKAFPQVGKLVLSLVPQTSTGPSPCFDPVSLKQPFPAPFTKSSKDCFWKADVQLVAAEWRVHQKNIQLCKGSAEEEYILYLGKRMRDVELITQHAEVCIEWAVDRVNERKRELNKIRNKRCEAIRVGLVALGFEHRDIDSVMQLPIAQLPTPLTPTAWAQVQSQLVPLVKVRRNSRIILEGMRIREIRTSIFRESYAAYLFLLLPLDFWMPAHLPTVDDLLELDPFKSIIESDWSVVVDSSSFTAAIEDLQLPQLVAEWKNSTNNQI
ncbi:hypothetical protein BD779DRAFT_441174 [Infundibulicybe gibba]|nr:hypothetical protein BD779DRAFT_441174 [Infundibulicybe gibba]